MWIRNDDSFMCLWNTLHSKHGIYVSGLVSVLLLSIWSCVANTVFVLHSPLIMTIAFVHILLIGFVVICMVASAYVPRPGMLLPYLVLVVAMLCCSVAGALVLVSYQLYKFMQHITLNDTDVWTVALQGPSVQFVGAHMSNISVIVLCAWLTAVVCTWQCSIIRCYMAYLSAGMSANNHRTVHVHPTPNPWLQPNPKPLQATVAYL